MRVMCIYEGHQTTEYPVKFCHYYTVIREIDWWEVGATEGKKFYQLKEMPEDQAYWIGLFSPLSELNEMKVLDLMQPIEEISISQLHGQQ